jgi:2-keto-4-pentenoate hydratase
MLKYDFSPFLPSRRRMGRLRRVLRVCRSTAGPSPDRRRKGSRRSPVRRLREPAARTRRHRARLFGLLAPIGYVLALVTGGAGADAENWAEIIVEESRKGAAMPVLSAYGAELDVATAYEIQRMVVENALSIRAIGGYKAGFTNAASRARFQLDEPVAGVLFADGRIDNGAEIRRDAFKRLMIEVEIGYVLRSTISRRMKSVADLKTYVLHAVPAIELPDLDYEDMDHLQGLDIVATNMGAAAYLVGEPFRFTDLEEVNLLRVALYRDGELIDDGHAVNAFGDQLRALLWLVNDRLARGWKLAAGQLLLTGALGKINSATSGDYHADYGRGELRFRVVEGAARASAQGR